MGPQPGDNTLVGTQPTTGPTALMQTIHRQPQPPSEDHPQAPAGKEK